MMQKTVTGLTGAAEPTDVTVADVMGRPQRQLRRTGHPPLPPPESATLFSGRHITTHTGTVTVTRPATEDDFGAVNMLHDRCSLDSRFSRYQSARRSLSASEWRNLVHPDRGRSWVTHPVDSPHLLVASTHLMHTGHDQLAELGILVEDTWQNFGLGTQLARHAITQAHTLEVKAITVMTSRDNRRMLTICKNLGAHSPRQDGVTISFTLPVN
ncbi:GNAT family N-acetyltransferase [Streptomyces nigra]|uniref:GNAT family N-acetyltransferase n=1 Tax=Streptomyces nigra TaxID=1827580 RepID=UPI003453AF15